MNDDITHVVDAAQTIIDATSPGQSTPEGPSATTEAVAEGIAEGVAAAAQLLQTDEEFKAWQASVSSQLTTLEALIGDVKLLAAAPVLVPEPAPAASILPVVETVTDENQIELPLITPETAATEVPLPEITIPVAVPQLHPNNTGRRATSPRKWL